jgi:hypothetical protein
MPDEPQRIGNAGDAALEPTERRDLIFATLAVARGYLDLWGRFPSTQEVEEYLTGKRSL